MLKYVVYVRNNSVPSDVAELIEYMETEFGKVAVRPVHKGENLGWYLDQRLASILISDWEKQHGRVKLVPRRTNTDRSV